MNLQKKKKNKPVIRSRPSSPGRSQQTSRKRPPGAGLDRGCQGEEARERSEQEGCAGSELGRERVSAALTE